MSGNDVHHHRVHAATAVALLWSSAAAAVAPAGIPDPAFGGIDAPPGFAIESFDEGQNGQDRASAFVETLGGNLLLVGGVTGAGPSCIGLMRFDADGVLDDDFGVEGKICHPLILGSDFQVQYIDFDAVALPDGRTLVAGNAVDSGARAFVCRFLASGDRDLSFGAAATPGCTVLPHLVTQGDRAPVLAADTQAVVVVTAPAHDDVPVLTRLSALDGALQPYDQQNATPILSPAVFASSVPRDAAFTVDGDLLIAGAGNGNGKLSAFVSRFDLTEGQPVATFGSNGARVIDYGSVQASATSIRVLASGEVLVAAVVQSANGEVAGVARISSVDGASDPAFNGGAASVFPTCNIAQCDITELQVEQSQAGRIFLAGALDVLSQQSIFAARVNPDGSPDVPYGPEPQTGISLFASNTVAQAGMVLQGKQVVLGGTLAFQQGSDFVLVRLGDEEIFADGFESAP